MASRPVHGRGSSTNPANRFVSRRILYEEDPHAEGAPQTRVYEDSSRSVLSFNDSPDLGFDVSLNPYRGCEHGCAYCYARPTHEYLDLSAGLDFETVLFAKPDAPKLLARALDAPGWKPRPIAISGVTDAYQPVERELGITRRCLEVLAERNNPASIVTKSNLVRRDIDLLKKLNQHNAINVYLSITTVDAALAAVMEPRAPRPSARLRTLQQLSEAGIPTGVLVAPLIPGLTDEQLPEILSAAARAGARTARYILLRLPHGTKELFDTWLKNHQPLRRDRVLNRLRDMRGGNLYDSDFSQRQTGSGPHAEALAGLFNVQLRRHHLHRPLPELSSRAFKQFRQQGSLFDLNT